MWGALRTQRDAVAYFLGFFCEAGLPHEGCRTLLSMPRITLTLLLAFVLSCGSSDDPTDAGSDAASEEDAGSEEDASSADGGTTASNITDAEFTNRDGSCAAYAGSYFATVSDLMRETEFMATLTIAETADGCTVTSNSLPNHDFNDTGAFATAVAEVTETFNVPLSPTMATEPTPLSLEYDNAIMLNGVKLDRLAAACYGVGDEPLGMERIGCMQTDTPWRYDPMSPAANFGTDSHNAHTQPDGAYHYHGDPGAMYDTSGATVSGVIGFAADGFPIFGPYFDDDGTIRRAVSGYTLREGARVSQDGEGAFPAGDYDGTYVDDYEWTDAGDLDECNGMTVDGQYGYHVTAGYPGVVGCFRGTPDPSFRKMMGGPGV